MDFNKKVEYLCQKNGISLTGLAKGIGIAPSTAADWKKKNAKPQNKTLKKIADYFGVSMSYFDDDNDLTVTAARAGIVKGNIEFVSDYTFYNVPVYESVSAGFGSYASDFVVDYMPLPFKTEAEAKESLVLKVEGDSMYPKIESGDHVQVRKQTSVDSGTLAVVLLDEEEGLIKKVVYSSDYISLISLNPAYEPMIFSGSDIQRIRVVGKVTKIIREP